MHACFDFRLLDSPQVSMYWCFSTLQGMAASTGSSNFFSVFLNGFFELLIIHINKIDASPLSRIVELRFLDSPLLLFLPLSCFCHSGTNFWPQMIRPCCCLNLCQSIPDHENPSGGVSYNIVNCVKPVQDSEWFRSASIFE